MQVADARVVWRRQNEAQDKCDASLGDFDQPEGDSIAVTDWGCT